VIYPYRLLARYYDTFFESLRDPLHAARECVLGPIRRDIKSGCDLACGTGTTAVELAQAGIRMYAVDLSAGMCRLARDKARRAGVPLRVIQGDMRSFRLPQPVDLVICEFDALNHVPERGDLGRVAKAVARALDPEGWFYFDVNNALGFRTFWSDDVWFERPGVAMVMRNRHSRKGDRGWSDIEWFIRRGRHWHRQHEYVEEICWTAAEIRRALRDAGFERVLAWDATPFFGGNPLIRPGCRTVWLGRKSRS
jgi:SAM-dependent methyltransferase